MFDCIHISLPRMQYDKKLDTQEKSFLKWSLKEEFYIIYSTRNIIRGPLHVYWNECYTTQFQIHVCEIIGIGGCFLLLLFFAAVFILLDHNQLLQYRHVHIVQVIKHIYMFDFILLQQLQYTCHASITSTQLYEYTWSRSVNLHYTDL